MRIKYFKMLVKDIFLLLQKLASLKKSVREYCNCTVKLAQEKA